MSADRALADAITATVTDAAAADAPLQGIVQAHDPATRTCQVLVDGQVGTWSYEGAYTPNIADLVWLRGPAGAKVITGRMGPAAREELAAAVVELVADHRRGADPDGHRIALYHVDETGTVLPNAVLELRFLFADQTAFLVNPHQDIGLLFGNTAVKVTSADGTADRDLYVATLHGTVAAPSSQRLKYRRGPVDDAQLDALLATPIEAYEYRDIAIGADRPPRFVGPMAEHAPPVMQRRDDAGLGIDLQTWIGLLHAALRREHDTRTAQLAAHRAELDDLGARLDELHTTRGEGRTG